MKPMTTIRLRVMTKKTSNAEHPTPNVECRRCFSGFDIRRSALGVRRLLLSLKCLHRDRRIAGDDRVWRNAFRDDRARGNDRVFADGYAFQNYRIHTDPDIVGNSDWRGFQLGPRRTIFEKWRERLRVDKALGRLEWMKIGISDADVPRDETV